MRLGKLIISTHFRAWSGCALVLGVFIWLAMRVPTEPTWHGRPLSEWLAAYDSNLRFDEGDGRRSKFTDAEIQQALDEIGPAALPFLRQWLTEKPSRVSIFANRLLNHQSWISFRFQENDKQSLAETGFMAYGPDAQALLGELIKLSDSEDGGTRTLAYEAAFFTRPPRETFLPLATRALKEQNGGIRAMAAQWLRERFPADAEKVGLSGSLWSQIDESPAMDRSSDNP